MTDHLSASLLNALADGELSADQLAVANEHLAGCPSCTSNALYQSLLKSATAKAGQRYTPPPQLQATACVASEIRPGGAGEQAACIGLHQQWRFGSLGWAAAAVLLLVSASMMLVQRNIGRRRLPQPSTRRWLPKSLISTLPPWRGACRRR